MLQKNVLLVDANTFASGRLRQELVGQGCGSVSVEPCFERIRLEQLLMVKPSLQLFDLIIYGDGLLAARPYMRKCFKRLLKYAHEYELPVLAYVETDVKGEEMMRAGCAKYVCRNDPHKAATVAMEFLNQM